MRWFTHLLGGLTSLWPLALLPNGLPAPDASCAGTTGIAIAAALFGSLAPDLDARESRIKNLRVGSVRPFHALGTIAHRLLGHRAFLHSLAGLCFVTLLVSLPLALLVGWQPALAFALGYASHLALDACTIRGIPCRYPNLVRFHLIPPAWRVVTGGEREDIVTTLLLIAVLPLLILLALRLTFVP